MSDEQKSNGKVDPVVQPFIDFWSKYIEQANERTRELLDDFNGGADVKSWQRRWSEAVSKSMDAYMRSPVFLQGMKQNTDLLIKSRQKIDDATAEFARNANIPTAGDISGLFERLHSIEEVILGRLGHLDKRLDAIEGKIGIREMAEN